MRRLKFRQWNKSANQFHYWGYVDEDDTFTSPIHGESQQFTGLLDRNLKEIYEGDIIKVVEDITDTSLDILGKRYGFRTPSEMGRRSIYGREFIAPVIWNDKSTGFTLAYRWADTGEVDDHIRINPRESEVIGNIYEKAPIPMLLFYESKAQERIEKAKEGENDN